MGRARRRARGGREEATRCRGRGRAKAPRERASRTPRTPRRRRHLKRTDDGRPAIILEETQARWKTCRGYVENVAHAVALAADERAKGRIYDVADTHDVTEAE
ncbi:hypothetical protein LIP_0301 [Limnochorda pilosa]|uniref:Uncharacterized protein n=1 Tax=Limnochorda pilosa TaxID=1555112 RepID=A0A0K2SGD6_LIMPI|nr:hypothetical protein LIP_0301 [Limnochorda pilosa]